MAQEFTINSSDIESKINQLLPSQGGFGAGVDFTASTMVIPIVDLTESAEGSALRQDLQSAFDFNITEFNINNASNTTIIDTTGYYRVFGSGTPQNADAASVVYLELFDGVTAKKIFTANTMRNLSSIGNVLGARFDFIVRISAGELLRGTANASTVRISGIAKQIADINGNLS